MYIMWNRSGFRISYIQDLWVLDLEEERDRQIMWNRLPQGVCLNIPVITFVIFFKIIIIIVKMRVPPPCCKPPPSTPLYQVLMGLAPPPWLWSVFGDQDDHGGHIWSEFDDQKIIRWSQTRCICTVSQYPTLDASFADIFLSRVTNLLYCCVGLSGSAHEQRGRRVNFFAESFYF